MLEFGKPLLRGDDGVHGGTLGDPQCLEPAGPIVAVLLDEDVHPSSAGAKLLVV